jgi:hypothetical protein
LELRDGLNRALGTLAVCSCLVAGGCGASDPNAVATPVTSASVADQRSLRIYQNPYASVDWSRDLRLTAQHHDHVGMRNDYILAYDAAGYDVVSLMDYSGNVELPYALRQRVWPVEQWVPQSTLGSLKAIKLFLPNAEEVGVQQVTAWDPAKHATSPFLTTYIEGAQKTLPGAPELPLSPNQYRTIEQLFQLVRSQGGFPCLAHPWTYRYTDLDLGASYCTEIYNAIADVHKERGLPWYVEKDRNQEAVTVWDQALIRNQRIFGIAVNDHFGPQTAIGVVSNKVRDSGKIVVFAKAATLTAYRAAFEAGSFFAVRDYGDTKNLYPRVHSVAIAEGHIYVETSEAVKWIANGQVVGTEPMLPYGNFPSGARYVRAEVSNPEGSTVYTQAFPVRPIGDVDGDYDIDADDDAICQGDAQQLAANIVATSACAARL